MALRFDAIVVGGGVIGVSSALHLAERGLRVAICDPRPLLSLTSARSTECYRDLWDSPVMSSFVRSSITGMERRLQEAPGAFAMFPRGAFDEAGFAVAVIRGGIQME
jgi:glycine/D-amino acid oxidase-like deaminating enzyme